jgi:hypothetical protein
VKEGGQDSWVFQLNYKIPDQLILTGAFSKNFGTANNLISLLGLNLGLSSGSEKATVK